MIRTKYPLVLASASPRRRQLLEQITHGFTAISTEADESSIQEREPAKLVAALSALKARWAVEHSHTLMTAIGSDTVVSVDGCVLGKPHTEQEAFSMLSRLRGRTHRVYTGVTLWETGGRCDTRVECTEVTFAAVTDEELWEYIRTGDPMDKAGAYGIQGEFARHVSGIKGCYFNVMGLPLHLLYTMLKEFL